MYMENYEYCELHLCVNQSTRTPVTKSGHSHASAIWIKARKFFLYDLIISLTSSLIYIHSPPPPFPLLRMPQSALTRPKCVSLCHSVNNIDPSGKKMHFVFFISYIVYKESTFVLMLWAWELICLIHNV